MKKSIKKISGVVLFSTILSVGVAVSPIFTTPMVYAETIENDSGLIDLARYRKTPINNLYETKKETAHTNNQVSYATAIQQRENAQATNISLTDSIFSKPLEDRVGTVGVSVNNYAVKSTFKKGEKIKIKETISDYLKLQENNLNSMGISLNESIMKETPFIFTNDKNEDEIVYPDEIKLSLENEGKNIVYEFEVTVPIDSSYMYDSFSPYYLGSRNSIPKDSSNYKKIEAALEGKQSVNVVDSVVEIKGDKDKEIVPPFTRAKIDFYNDTFVSASKNNVLYKSLGLVTLFDTTTGFPYTPNESETINEAKGNQNIKANVLNGGITGGIVNPEVGQDLSVRDVDFGELSIGKAIEPIKEDSMVSVRDWTGGNGWKLTAQHKEADRNQSLQLGVQVNENAKVNLNNEAQPVTSGESQLETITQGGTYTAKWGTHPTVGEFNNVIEWNLSANVTE